MNQPQLRIRMIVGSPLWPLQGGRQLRGFPILKALTQAGKVDLLCLVDKVSEEDREGESFLERICRRVVIAQWPANTGPSSSRFVNLVSMLRGEVNSARRIDSRDLSGGAKEILHGDYDLNWVAGVVTYERINLAPDCRCVVDIDDIRHRELLRTGGASRYSLKQRVGRCLRGRAWRRLELGAIMKTDCSLVCSRLDRDFLADDRVRIVRNSYNGTSGSEVSAVADLSMAVGSKKMLMIGNMDYEPNIDGVEFFCREILPVIRERIPTASFVVVGKGGGERLEKCRSIAGVDLVGKVEDLTPFLQEAAFSLVPLRMGSGTRLKVLESLYYGRAVVSTYVGAEGLELLPGKHILLAELAEEFAHHCIQLLEDPALARNLAEAGQSYIREEYSWDRVKEDVDEVIDFAMMPKPLP
jgi:hypothetical protein